MASPSQPTRWAIRSRPDHSWADAIGWSSWASLSLASASKGRHAAPSSSSSSPMLAGHVRHPGQPAASRIASRSACVVGVVLDRLVEEELQVVGVLHPARLGHDREVAAQLAGPLAEAAPHLGHGQRAPLRRDPRVDRVAHALVPLAVHPLLRRARLVDRELLGDLDPVLDPGDDVADQVPSRPVVRVGDRSVELLVGQRVERLERAQRLALLLQELQCVQVHAVTTLRPRPARGTRRRRRAGRRTSRRAWRRPRRSG